jgi:hypothetical protein
MPVAAERRRTRVHGLVACGVAGLLASLLLALVAWSWIAAPVRVPLGPHAVAFGQLYTSRRRPPPGHRPVGMVGNPRARTRIFRIAGGLYFIGWR